MFVFVLVFVFVFVFHSLSQRCRHMSFVLCLSLFWCLSLSLTTYLRGAGTCPFRFCQLFVCSTLFNLPLCFVLVGTLVPNGQLLLKVSYTNKNQSLNLKLVILDCEGFSFRLQTIFLGTKVVAATMMMMMTMIPYIRVRARGVIP